MSASDAERQRRYRAHKRGNHSLCDPERDCRGGVTPAVTGAVTSDDVTQAPAGLGKRGRRLWRELATASTPPAQRVLMEEACRIADRLERLDTILRHELDLKLASEARQQAVALKQIVAEIRQSAGAAGKPTGQQGGSLRDQLAARRAARLASAAGS